MPITPYLRRELGSVKSKTDAFNSHQQHHLSLQQKQHTFKYKTYKIVIVCI